MRRRRAARRTARSAPRARRAARPASTVPGDQCAPRITHGTTCSSRQNTARRSPSGSNARKPSSAATASPHQLQCSPVIAVSLPAGGAADIVPRHARSRRHRRPRGRPDRPGTARSGAARARARGHRRAARPAALRPVARGAPRDAPTTSSARPPRAMREAGFGIKAATVTPEGADDVGSPEPDPARGRRRARDHPHRPADPRRDARRGRAPPDLDRADGRRGRLRRRAVARGHGRRAGRGRLPHRADHARRPAARSPSTRSAQARRMGGRVYGGPKWTVSPVYEGMLKEEMDAAAERHPGRPLPAGPHRRDLRGADHGRRRRAARRSRRSIATATA